tara:strand:+ start:107 stop:1204 length:1098 start_codon:yes stop_codon:yes gene_type:complete
MKHIKYVTISIVVFFSAFLTSQINNDIKAFYEQTYQKEKDKFFECLNNEELDLVDQLYTKCKLSLPLKDSSYIVLNKPILDVIDLLPDVEKYKAIKKSPPKYPSLMQRKGQMGYVIIRFDINKDGNVENTMVVNGFCGDIYNPMTKYETCDYFNKNALKAISNFEYTPTRVNGYEIRHNNLLHKFSFAMAENERIELKKARGEYNKIILALKKDDLIGALNIANQNLENDNHFLYQKAAIKFKQKKYAESVDLFYEFSNKVTEDRQAIKENFHISTFSMLISSLFNLGRFEEIIELEKDYLIYISNRNKISTASPITDFYIGASYANLGNFSKGIFYISKAQKNVGSKAEYNYIDSVIKQLKGYY